MDINFDQFGAERGGKTWFAPPEQDAPLDWHGLAARLAAAHASRQAVGAGEPGRIRGNRATGSFAPRLARQVAAYAGNTGTSIEDTAAAGQSVGEPLHRVNLEIKADGKPPCAIGSDIAGAHKTGVRGLL